MYEETVIGDLLGYNLISKEDFPSTAGAQTLLFSGLEGESDEEYLLKYFLYIHAGSATRNVTLRFNEDIGGNYRGGEHYFGETGAHSYNAFSGTSGRFCRNMNNANMRLFGECKINAKMEGSASNYRPWQSTYVCESGTNYYYKVDMYGWWANAADEITSISINTVDSGTAYYISDGWVALYRKTPTW